MTEAECRAPEPNALLERLLRRYTEPFGVIDVRHTQAHYARIAGWMEARFPLLVALAARHDLGADAEGGTGAFIYAGRTPLRPSDQAVHVPGTPAVPAPALPRGDGMSEKSRLAPVFVDPHTFNVVQNHFHKSGSPFSLREKANSFVDDFDPLTPTLSRREREKKAVPVSEGPGDAQDVPPSAADPVIMARSSRVSPEVTPAKTVWHVRRAAPGMTTVPSPGSTPSPDPTSDPPHTPAVGAPPRGRPARSPDQTSDPHTPPTTPRATSIQRKYSNVLRPDAQGEKQARGGETPADFDSLSISPSQRARKDGHIPIGHGGSAELSRPRVTLVRTKGDLDDLHRGAPSSAPPALGVPMDPRALPLARVRTPAANVDRSMETGDPRLQTSDFLHAPSLDRPRRGLRSGVTEHPPVSPASVPIPERPRLRLGKREWARLIERLSRLIRHRLAVDLDRRGIRSWR